MDDSESNHCWPNVNDFIDFAENLQKRVAKLGTIQGIRKLERKILAELKFMNQLKQRDLHTQHSRLKSSNLGHFASLIHASERLPGLAGVLVPYQLPSRTDSLLVDILALGGHAWVKVVARKAQALHLVWAGAGQFGERDLLDQASEYLECASRYPVNFCTPQVHFAFYNQVTEPMAAALERLGVKVWGERVPVDTAVLDKLEAFASDDSSEHSEDSDYDGHVRVTEGVSDSTLSFISEQRRNLGPDLIPASLGATQGDENEVVCSPNTICTPALQQLSSSSSNQAVCNPTSNSSDVLTDSAKEISTQGLASPSEQKELFLELVISPPDFESFASSAPSAENCDQTSAPSFPLTPETYPTTPHLLSPSTSTEGVCSIQRVNLDITSLIALVSSVTNGRCHLVFRDQVLSTQAREEREAPVLPVLNRFLQGKELFACETAVSSFRSILSILGGPEEKQRALDFLSKVKVVPDQPSPRAVQLECQGRIKERSKIVFGTGDTLHAITVTSNMGFVRAARGQGVVFPVFLHPARALTEEKEPNAKPLSVEIP